MKFLIIDNYDSFIYNLKYELNALGIETTICRNDIAFTKLEELAQQHDAIVLSPGPSNPTNAGHCIELVKSFYFQKPILGICLGHQVIAEAFGGKVTKAQQVVHGKHSIINIGSSDLFANLGASTKVARYHSLIAQELPQNLAVIASSTSDEVMAIEHKEFPVFGLQFHPESIMTLKGKQMIQNFKAIVMKNLVAKESRHVANA
ncbi:MAG: aminodeoxychorismate/anthranilate synthase component II [Gammaproteobacteria bacterium]|nr:aminodeoxychorismate/anthranilate synthase component II [Gammaproteobacteria bacterium]